MTASSLASRFQGLEERSYLLVEDQPSHFDRSINGIINQTREYPSLGLEVSQTVSNLAVFAISAWGFPYGGNNSDISLKCFIINDTAPKVWAGFNYVNNHFKAMVIRRKLYPDKSVTFYYIKTGIQIILETSIGLFSHFPDILSLKVSAQDNGADILALGDTFFRTLSTHLMIRATPKIYNSWGDSPQKRFFWLKQEFAQGVQRMKGQFIQMPIEERIRFAQSLQMIQREEISSSRIGKYLSKMVKLTEKNEPSSYREITTKIGKVALFSLVAYLFMAFPSYNWQLSKSDGLNDAGAGIFSILPCTALYLTYKCALRTLRQFYPMQWSLTSQLRKVKAVAYKGFGVLLSAVGAYGFQNTTECIETTNSVTIPPAFCIPFSLYLFIIGNVAIYDAIETALEASILSGENEEERRQILMKREFDKLIELIEAAPVEMFARFFRSLPNPIKTPLCEKFGFTEEDLERLF